MTAATSRGTPEYTDNNTKPFDRIRTMLFKRALPCILQMALVSPILLVDPQNPYYAFQTGASMHPSNGSSIPNTAGRSGAI